MHPSHWCVWGGGAGAGGGLSVCSRALCFSPGHGKNHTVLVTRGMGVLGASGAGRIVEECSRNNEVSISLAGVKRSSGNNEEKVGGGQVVKDLESQV